MEMLQKEKIRAISLSSTHLGSGGSRSFAKETLKRDISQPSEVDKDQLTAITEADPLKTTEVA